MRRLLLLLLLLAAPVHAQTLSPGVLGRAHEELEGLSNCTKCHEFGKKLDGQLCLACHTPVKKLVDTKHGFHGKPPTGKTCLDCHHDHRGVDAALMEWGGPKEKFDHDQTDWSLEGKHHAAKCSACHDSRHVQDAELKKRFSKGGTGTFLGLSTNCTACHFDEHRGQFKNRCESCHDFAGFKPAPRFDHDKASFKLRDAHTKVECSSCHASTKDNAPVKGFPAPVEPASFTRYQLESTTCRTCHFDEHRGQLKGECSRCHDQKSFGRTPGFEHDSVFKLKGAHVRVECAACHPSEPVARTASLLKPHDPLHLTRFRPTSRNCAGCHEDVHQQKFGKDCARCHNETSWRSSQAETTNPTFHDKSRFPLVGMHRQVSCEKCHPVNPDGTKVLTGFPFARCNNCHVDAHLGQMPKDNEGMVACEKCHKETGFYPSRFPLEKHQEARFPLEGAHQAVECSGCHKADPAYFASQVPPTVEGQEQKLTQLLNFTRIKMPEKDLSRCESCHQDPHRAQFSASEPQKACTTCHKTASFQTLTFNHDVDARFHLNGGHARVPCVECHTPSNGMVVYRGAARDCAHCHQDIHQGQFVDAAHPDGNCGRCHGTNHFKPTFFRHGDAQFSNFELKGAHAGVACRKCHPEKTRDGTTFTWFRGIPNRCEGCHQNLHSETAP